MNEGVHVQFSESPTDERAETAYEIAMVQYHGDGCEVRNRGPRLTCLGDTSGIITKGTGPIPVANDLYTTIQHLADNRRREMMYSRHECQDCDAREGHYAGVKTEADAQEGDDGAGG